MDEGQEWTGLLEFPTGGYESRHGRRRLQTRVWAATREEAIRRMLDLSAIQGQGAGVLDESVRPVE